MKKPNLLACSFFILLFFSGFAFPQNNPLSNAGNFAAGWRSVTEGGLFPSHQKFANDLRHSLTFLEQANSDLQSFLIKGVENIFISIRNNSDNLTRNYANINLQ